MTVGLTQGEIDDALQRLKSWECRDGELFRRIEFDNFADAFAFMTRVALQAEKIDHHPDWSNCYNVVEIRLSSHDIGALSPRDLALADAIDRQLARCGGHK